MTSYMWSFVGYGLVAVFIGFIVFVIVMMRLATKDEKSKQVGLPQLISDEEATPEKSLFGDDADSTEAAAPVNAKKPARPFFKKAKGGALTTRKDDKDDDIMSFFEAEDFNLTDGSDVNHQ